MSGTAQRLQAAVNVDVDGLYLYDRIHGHSGGSGNSSGFDAAGHDATVWLRGVPRFLELFARCGVKGTFFVVAQDLAHPAVREVLARCVAEGHEIGSHSLTHPYNLSKLPRDQMDRELQDARKRLQDATGQPISGFRAPGYVLSEALCEAIVDAGHAWDSSRFPCPPYQAAKTAIIGLYRAQGRKSGSIPEHPAVWVGQRTPYVMRLRSGKALLELPIGVLPGIRWPVIGTSVIAAGEAGRIALAPAVARTGWVNFECHGIDLTDHEGDQIPARLKAQPDQRRPLSAKWPLMLKFLEQLAATHEVRTLGEWAAQADRL